MGQGLEGNAGLNILDQRKVQFDPGLLQRAGLTPDAHRPPEVIVLNKWSRPDDLQSLQPFSLDLGHTQLGERIVHHPVRLGHRHHGLALNPGTEGVRQSPDPGLFNHPLFGFIRRQSRRIGEAQLPRIHRLGLGQPLPCVDCEQHEETGGTRRKFQGKGRDIDDKMAGPARYSRPGNKAGFHAPDLRSNLPACGLWSNG